MNINDLKLFEAVAIHGNFTKAAESMFTVQSNVTARIKSLEEEFGATLFARTSRKVELTSAGKSLLNYSKQVINLIEEAKLSVRKSNIVNGQLKIGFLETTMALKGPDLINEFSDKFPLVDLELTSSMRDRLINDVLNYKLDAAFIPAPIHHEELEQIHVTNENIVAVTSLDFKSLDEILKQTLVKAIVFDQGCFFRARLETWLVNHGILNYHKTVINSVEGVVNFIESGIGFSFLPSDIVSKFYKHRKIKTFTLPKEIGDTKTVLIYRNNNLSSPVLQAFISLFVNKLLNPI